jgi:hypothetical protein
MKNMVQSSQEKLKIADRIGGSFVNFPVRGQFIKLPGVAIRHNAKDFDYPIALGLLIFPLTSLHLDETLSESLLKIIFFG